MIAGVRGIIKSIQKKKLLVEIEKVVSTLDSYAGKSPIEELIKEQVKNYFKIFIKILFYFSTRRFWSGKPPLEIIFMFRSQI